jgi:hypothetical protein
MVVNGIQAISTWLVTLTHWSDSIPVLLAKIPFSWIVIAQNVSDPDLGGRVQRAWDTFVKTGQIWAMLIGFILGYMIKGFTSFG